MKNWPPDCARIMRTQGLCVVRKAFSPDDIQRLEVRVAELVNRTPDGDENRHEIIRADGRSSIQVQRLFERDSEINRLTQSAGIPDAVACLTGGTPALWRDQAMIKPAFKGGFVNWHQDGFYWRDLGVLRAVSAWIALTPSTIEAGCLWYVPGSHLWDLLDDSSMPRSPDPAVERVRLLNLAKARRPSLHVRPVELEAGDVSFHFDRTLHASDENDSANARIGYIQNYVLERRAPSTQ